MVGWSNVEAKLVLKSLFVTVVEVSSIFGMVTFLQPALLEERAEPEGKKRSDTTSDELFPANFNFLVQAEVCFC